MIKKLFPALLAFLFFCNLSPYSFASPKNFDRFIVPLTARNNTDIEQQENKIQEKDIDTLRLNSTGKAKIGPGLNNILGVSDIASLSKTGPVRDRVRLIIDTTENNISVYDAISKYNARIINMHNGLIALECPTDSIEMLVNETDAIKNARLPARLFPLEVISEGAELINANNFKDAGFTGAGVRIAVIDVGFKGLTDAYLSGDIPYDASTYDFTEKGLETEYYHGTACAEIVYDMAPGAELYLLKVYDEIDIYDAIDFCIKSNIDIISMSIGTFGTGPGDGTGPFDEHFDEARENGILVVASTGNFGNMGIDYDNDGDIDYTFGSHWEGEFYDSDADDTLEFIQGDTDLEFNLIGAYPSQDDDGNPDTGEVSIMMRWDDWINRDIDYDMYLYEYDMISDSIGDLVSFSDSSQNGSQPPIEQIIIDLEDDEDTQYYALIVKKKTGEPDGTELEIYLGGTSTFLPFNGSLSAIAISASSVSEPADAESVLAVGAIYYEDWGTGPQEDFTSQGPTNGWAGSEARIKPDICGPDGVSTHTYGENAFFGTSASTPLVAGTAALVLSTWPDLDPDTLQSYIETNAIDMGTAGKDNLYGSGRINLPTVDITDDDTDTPDENNNGGGGGCFIATAAHGSNLKSHTVILHRFMVLISIYGLVFLMSFISAKNRRSIY